MKRIKIRTVFLLSAVLFFSLCLPAFADILVEPEDLFYHAHKGKCESREFRQYTVNTETGYSYIYLSPESSQTLKGISNGEVVGLQWFYTDKNGEEWGVRLNGEGWFRMADLTLVYDCHSFLEEYSDDIRDYEKGSYVLEATSENPVELWKYPGKKFEGSPLTDGDVADYVQKTYTDSQGVVWGYISYRYGTRHVWVCLSQGEEVTLPNSSTSEPNSDLKADPVPTDQIPMSEGNRQTLILVGCLVGSVVVVTAGGIAVLILVTRRRNKKTPGN